MNWVNTCVDNYYNWLREKTYVQEGISTGWSAITTPFIGAFNDTVEIYVKKDKTQLILSDNGETMSNLELQGLLIQGSKKRKNLLETILLTYGIKLHHNELLIECDLDRFSQAKHNLLSAIIEVSDLYVLSNHHVASIFKEDVRDYLESKDIIFTPDFISKGTTGLEFNFDFQIAKRQTEIVIKSFNTINKSNLSTFLFAWNDIKPVRERTTKKEVKAIAVINNIDKDVKHEYLDALKSKNADYILWSEKDSERSMRLVA